VTASTQQGWDVQQADRLRRLDNRTLEARTLNRTVRELSKHVGGDPTPPQLLPDQLGEVRRLPRGVRREAARRDRQGARAMPPLFGWDRSPPGTPARASVAVARG
jgi:hypothetical protein